MSLHQTARSLGRSKAVYGKIHAAQNPGAARIWYSKSIEPEWSVVPAWFIDGDECHNEEDMKDCAQRLWKLMQEVLSPRCVIVLIARFQYDLTLDEVGKMLDLTRERVRQIEKNGIRRLQSDPDVRAMLMQWPDYAKPTRRSFSATEMWNILMEEKLLFTEDAPVA